jgi:hypothetical protein
MRAIGVWVAVALTLSGCGALKKSKSVAKLESRQSVEHVSREVSRETVLEVYGDTLAGRVPLPFTITGLDRPGIMSPIRVPVKSQGIDLELLIDQAGISYRVVAKPTSKLRESTKEADVMSSSSAIISSTEERLEVEKKRGLSWWVIIAAVLIFAFFWMAWRLLNKYLKPF